MKACAAVLDSARAIMGRELTWEEELLVRHAFLSGKVEGVSWVADTMKEDDFDKIRSENHVTERRDHGKAAALVRDAGAVDGTEGRDGDGERLEALP